ncbi:Pr6Pr family membrane protein [Promicromonospora sp. NPDC023805]|uniref:Pr6Pr family membrane protein n=1 Tax=Promicromonospora sp. NPDC023805 TaxID=3154696 RepID=UPI003411CC7F
MSQEISGPDRATLARVLHLLVAALALGGFTIELVTAIVSGPGIAPTHAERIVRLFSYFTIESNLLIGGVSLALALDPRRDGPFFRVLRLDGLLCIAVTGIVYNTVLRGLVTLTPSGAVANVMLHVLAPLLAVIVWLWVGPRPRVSVRTVWWSVVYPIAWLVYTFIRGAATDWYPYPFLDVTVLGYGAALTNATLVAVVFLVLAWGVRWADTRLPATDRSAPRVT